MTDALGALRPARKTGQETFHSLGVSQGFDLLDFWQWSTSDLVSNATRGVLAEYIVARALGIPTSGVRREWVAYDLELADGTRIEVKSAAYLQTWAQTKLSPITFSVAKRLGWDGETNTTSTTPRRHADVYIFALLAHTDKATVDPLDLSQWQFWAVPTRLLDERKRSQHSITVPSLKKLVGEPVDYWSLAAQVESVRKAMANGTL